LTEEQEYKRFVWSNVIRSLVFLAAIISVMVLFEQYFPADAKLWLLEKTDRPLIVLGVYLFSETFFGILPPEFFIGWASQYLLSTYIGYVALFASLSMVGASLAYWAGTGVNRIRFFRKMMLWDSFKRYARIYRRWGGIVIIISALTPLPYATISFLSAAFGFPFHRYLLYASTRLIRFAILGYIFWHV
jgi:hypothetical protein